MLDTLEIHQPATVEEASRLLSTYGLEAAVYAGGTELLVIMKERLVHYPHLIDIKPIPGLDAISIQGRSLVIGALATHRSIERSPLVREHAPLLAELESHVANLRVRSAGTIGGNLCFAEPHSDPATLLIAWDATVTLTCADGSRSLALNEFFTGLLETVRRADEILTDIRIPLLVPTASAYERFKTHERPTANVAVALRFNGEVVEVARIVTGSVCDRPTRMVTAEASLIGHPLDGSSIEKAAQMVHGSIQPTEDAFESTAYKRHLARVLTKRALEQAVGRQKQVNDAD
jgi:carbon-monoxide dehydrogenase medium subunit